MLLKQSHIYIYIHTQYIFNHIQVYELPWGPWQIGNYREGTMCFDYVYPIYLKNDN